MGRYDEGWQKLREERVAKAVSLGIFAPDVEMTTMSSTADWDALDAERQRFESKRMAVYAGMVEAMDAHIGRLVAYLKETGQFENTIFVFTSDNGAEGSGVQDMSSFAAQRAVTGLGYNSDYETLGLKGSFNSINPGFTRENFLQ